MKIAVTADLHLTTRIKHPDRFKALESMLKQLNQEKIRNLIIAGDLFDANSRQYSEFDELCKLNPSFQFLIIPGNHDARLKNSSFTSENIQIFDSPEKYLFDLVSLPFFFIPYQPHHTMGDVIQEHINDLPSDQWILIGHGDWTEGMKEPNPLEPGVYMPLTRIDLEKIRPACAVLGHIHKPMDREKVHYAGSPVPLDINETGVRRFLIVDTDTAEVEERKINSGPVYFNERFIVLPVNDEKEFIQKQIYERIKNWSLTKEELERVQCRIKVSGYSSNKKVLALYVHEALSDVELYNSESADLTEIYDADDPEKAEIVQYFLSILQDTELMTGPDEPDRDEILMQALHLIYEE